MDWQLLTVGVIVAGAVLYLARQSWRTWAGTKSGCGGCGGGCGKPSKTGQTKGPVLIPIEQLQVRRRPAGPL
jgi:hypothetical protein